MRNKALAVIFLAALLGVVSLGGPAWADKYETPSGEAEEEMVLKNSEVFTQPRRGPVNFSHRAHHEDYKLKCTQCHHEFEEGKNVWRPGDAVGACADCHTSPYFSDEGMPSLWQAYHRNCRDCHKSVPDAPQSCEECHQ